MTVFFVTRHAGAKQWARSRGIEAKIVDHLDPETVACGDTVLGTLPVHLAAEVCGRGAKYFHLSMDIPAQDRGQSLTVEQMIEYNARLEQYDVRKK